MSEEKTTTMQPAQSRVEVLDYLEIRRPRGLGVLNSIEPDDRLLRGLAAEVRSFTTDAAVEFLHGWAPEGPWVLTAVRADRKGIETRTFRPEGEVYLRTWLDTHNGKRNLYFHVNPPTRDLSKKAEHENIASVDWLHIDVDPRAGEDPNEERARSTGLRAETEVKWMPVES